MRPWPIVNRFAQCHVRLMSRSAEAQNPLTFETIGIHPRVAAALLRAFDIKTPTEIQTRLIPAILSGQNNILLKDITGSGKSFGTILGLVSKPRVRYQGVTGKLPAKQSITSLFIVPHRDLAHQLLWWIQKLLEHVPKQNTKTELSAVAQVLVRDGSNHLTHGVQLLKSQPPHIVIATPQALLDVYRQDATSLQLNTLSTVVVDEADYLIESGHSNNEWKRREIAKRLERHTSPTKELLDAIYMPSDLSRTERPARAPQLIMSSATMNADFRHFLRYESGWFTEGSALPILGSSGSELPRPREGYRLSHSVLTVSSDGVIKNVDNAVANNYPPDDFKLGDSSSAVDQEPFDISASHERYGNTESPFNTAMLEAIATIFALDVPSIALLVLPSTAPIQRAVYELQKLGVNARPLNLSDSGKSQLIRGTHIFAENPLLLITTLSITRGLDFPELSHVFLYGLPAEHKISRSGLIDTYLHIAGRVGRFERGGNIITVVEEGQEMTDKQTRPPTSDPTRMNMILQKFKIRPSKLEHFP